ncbi:MAG: hypothetical protein HYV09_08265 [Deltaproteobacteria bacterium]|nr:hypothetical protein [Deltaproteobacteria bacterium]
MVSTARPLDLIVQRSTLELLEAIGVPAAPRLAGPSQAPMSGQFAGLVRFSAPAFRGALSLTVPTKILARTVRASANEATLLDWLRELTNQLMGRLKNKLVRYQLLVRVAASTSGSAATMETQFRPIKGSERVYMFRTMTDDVVVRLRGELDDKALVFSSTAEVIDEGDVILF